MDTKTRLLDSAERAARRHGYDGFSYADLAADVGIRKASIHHHYRSKSDLALALIQRYRKRFLTDLDRIANKHRSAAAQLKAYISLYRAALSGGDTLCLCIALSISRDSLSGNIMGELNKFHKESVDWLTDVFARGVEDGSIDGVDVPKEEAIACLALMEGAQLLGRSSRSVTSFNRAVKQMNERCG